MEVKGNSGFRERGNKTQKEKGLRRNMELIVLCEVDQFNKSTVLLNKNVSSGICLLLEPNEITLDDSILDTDSAFITVTRSPNLDQVELEGNKKSIPESFVQLKRYSHTFICLGKCIK